VGDISREGCRDYAKRRFDIHRLALEYVNVYGRVRQRKSFFSLPLIEAESGRRAEPQAEPRAEAANGRRRGEDVVRQIVPSDRTTTWLAGEREANHAAEPGSPLLSEHGEQSAHDRHARP
jgi:hypothetical protein